MKADVGDEVRPNYMGTLVQKMASGERLERTILKELLGEVASQLAESDVQILQAMVRKLVAGRSTRNAERELTFYLELLANQPHLISILRAKAQSAAQLFASAKARTPLSAMVRSTFGVLSECHEHVLTDAIREGALTPDDVIACMDRGAELTARLGPRAVVQIPLQFRTVTLDGMPDAPSQKAGPHFDEPVAIKTKTSEFGLCVSSECELRQAALCEEDLIAWLDSTLEPTSVLFDVGANVGFYSLYAAHACSGVRVFAFEPAPLNFARLANNIHYNRAHSVTALPLGLSDRHAIVSFTSTHVVAGGWSHGGILQRDSEDARESELKTACVVDTLDRLVASEQLVTPTHLKIDVDGPEMQVLRGASQTLHGSGIRHVMVEGRDSQAAAEITAFMKEHGFRAKNEALKGFGNRYFEKP
jgi:FkbM family methyltransferase